MAGRAQGPVEKATRALVRQMGQISARQQVTAQAAYRLARLVDDEPDGSKASALSRELRQLVAELTPAAQPLPRKQTKPAADPITKIQDDLARKRQQREKDA